MTCDPAEAGSHWYRPLFGRYSRVRIGSIAAAQDDGVGVGGDHTVELDDAGRIETLGRGASGITLIALAGYGIWYRVRRRASAG